MDALEVTTLAIAIAAAGIALVALFYAIRGRRG